MNDDYPRPCDDDMAFARHVIWDFLHLEIVQGGSAYHYGIFREKWIARAESQRDLEILRQARDYQMMRGQQPCGGYL